MEIKPLKKINGLDYDQSKIQAYVAEWIDQVRVNPFVIGERFELSLTSGTTVINHGFGTIPTGWLILRKDANQNIWETARNDKQLILQASGNVQVLVWVF